MNKRITYLTGAGASYFSLPLIRTMGFRMQSYSRFLKKQREIGRLKHDFADQFIIELDQLTQVANSRTSIDAHAKALYLGGDEMKLLHLKGILSSYLIFEQLVKPDDLVFYSETYDLDTLPYDNIPLPSEYQEMIKTHIDKRYFTFWGEILTDKTDNLNNNVQILSWNYDMQFETSYAAIKHYSLELTQQILQVFPSPLKDIDQKKFCILKLNGTAGLIDEYSQNRLYNLFDFSQHKLLENLDFLIDLLAKNYHRAFYNPLFYFAWEEESLYVNRTRQFASDIIEDTDILVIIGYSFPNFNKPIDKQIFKNIDKLEKIYFQTLPNEMPQLIEKLNGINPKMQKITKGIPDVETFYIPHEL